MQKLPIGISDFKRVIENNYYYVDKSLFIKEIIDSDANILLLPRPRRFGKTLNLSMLRYFFEKTDNDNSILFNKLDIWNEAKEYTEKQGTYPVIYLTFKDVKQNSWNDTYSKIKLLIQQEFIRHKYLKNWDKLEEEEIDYFNQMLSIQDNKENFEISLNKLSEFLFRYHKQKVIILVDEYDTPIHSGYIHSFYDNVISFLRNFLSSGFKDNVYLEKGVLTGILRVAKESVFSGMNNLGVYSLTSKKFSTKFGFTVDEVEQLISSYDLTAQYDELIKWYNGYIFGENIIYNPWSILNWLANPEDGFIPYWINTSSNDIIKNLIINGKTSLKKNIYELLDGKTITKPIDDHIVFKELESNDDAIWSFFLFSGYLKASYNKYMNRKYYYKLSIPNEEVFTLYDNIIRNWLSESIGSDKLNYLLKALISGDVKTFEIILQEFVISVFSYFDTKKDETENVYQAFILGLLINLQNNYEVRSNRESGFGRYDVMLIPKDKKKKGIIIELKKPVEFTKETLKQAVDDALEQIEKQKYDTELLEKGVTDILKLGIAVLNKRVMVKAN